MSRDERGRSVAEWTTFALSLVVLLAVVGLIVGEMRGTSAPPAPKATATGHVRRVGGRFQVDVKVVNEGDETAANVQVSAELEVNGSTTSADQTIDFLAGSAEQDLVFIFADDPGKGSLTVEVTGFASP